MRRIIYWYVGIIVAIALLGGVALYSVAPPSNYRLAVVDASVLCTLAITAELLRFLLPRSASGSIGYIPYFAVAIISPAWPTVLGVAVAKTVTESWIRRAPVKAALNVASYVVMELIAISVYLALGGQSLHAFGIEVVDLIHVTKVVGIPALVALGSALAGNNLIVNGAISLSSRRPLHGVIQENHRSTIGIDFIAAPIVFMFAWVYAAFGPIAAAACWVPIMGLRQMHRTNLELEQTNEELLELMVRSLEARDPYTSGHSRRVRQSSITIARAIGLGAKQIEGIGRAALLHDVGKIYDKYAGVLSKEDKLTAEEWALIQEHPVDGANLIATMTRLRELIPAVRHHHENWNGTGYPDRISGDAIPLAARIIRFADTIDAMTTDRPYRRPLSESQVRAEIIRCRGTQFDPEIADRLLASPLWHTLFTPASPGVNPTPQGKIGQLSGRVRRARATHAIREA